jgi:hypothetical protein
MANPVFKQITLPDLSKKRNFYRIINICLFVSAFFALQWFCKRQTGGFTLQGIRSDLPFHPEWEVSSSPEDPTELKKIFNQPYHFLNKGAQCYAFISQDEHYVIKFFRFSHLRSPVWLRKLPTPAFLQKFKHRKILKRESKLYKDFTSYLLAYHYLKEDTGLIYLHLNKTDHLHRSLKIYDKLQIGHTIDLDQFEFLVQKKATLIYPSLEQWIENKKWNEAKKGLKSLISLLKKRLDQGIYDKDPDLNTNFGFINEQAVQIDIGRFKTGLQFRPQDELARITDHLCQWLEAKAPELSIFLKEEINAIYEK